MRKRLAMPRTAAGWSIAGFGAMALGLGVAGLVNPRKNAEQLGFEPVDDNKRPASDGTLTFATAASMASVNMGVYYLLAAATETRDFYRWTVPFRLVTTTVFSAAVVRGVAPKGFAGVAAWEGVGALATAAALAYDKRKSAAIPGV